MACNLSHLIKREERLKFSGLRQSSTLYVWYHLRNRERLWRSQYRPL